MLRRFPQTGGIESSPPEEPADGQPPLGADPGIEGGKLLPHASEARRRWGGVFLPAADPHGAASRAVHQW
jgi:hypothetical protein